MKLSKNLTLGEVIRSDTAKREGIDNYPTMEHLENLKILAEKVFQPIRDHFGTPVYVSSGYRSEALNKLLKGSPTSYHMKGMAIDIDQDGFDALTNKEIFYFIRDYLEFTELIWEFYGDNGPAWVHVAYDKDNLSKEVLIAYKENNKTKYERWER